MIYQDIGFEDLTSNAVINPDTHIKAQYYQQGKWCTLAGVDLAKYNI